MRRNLYPLQKQIIEYISQVKKNSVEDAFEHFYNSRVFDLMVNTKTDLPTWAPFDIYNFLVGHEDSKPVV